tara:strand:- start:3999 stop:4277 length:279 start_codon:yes stop_codon:yes gene_type:complete
MITGKDVLDDEDLRTFSVKIEGKLVKVDGIFTGNSAKFIMLADIPRWLEKRLAVLERLPPEQNGYFIEGIGRRVSSTIYWVVKPTEEDEEDE